MKTLQNNFTTPEQSKRLLELGVPVDSADMKYPIVPCCSGSAVLTTDIVVSCKELGDGEIPSWSVGRLIEICTICIYHYTGNNTFIFDKGSLRLGYIQCLIAALEMAHDDGDVYFSKLED